MVMVTDKRMHWKENERKRGLVKQPEMEGEGTHLLLDRRLV